MLAQEAIQSHYLSHWKPNSSVSLALPGVSLHCGMKLLQAQYSEAVDNNGGTAAAAPPPSCLATLPSVGAVP